MQFLKLVREDVNADGRMAPGIVLKQVERDIAAVETSTERRDALQKQIADLARSYEAAARKLSAKRKEAARQLSKRVEAELAALAMDQSRVDIQVRAGAWSAAGSDEIEFLISPNPGEEPKPLEKIASGAGIKRTRTVATDSELADGARLLREGNGTAFVVLKVKPDDPPPFKRNLDPASCRIRFRSALLGSG